MEIQISTLYSLFSYVNPVSKYESEAQKMIFVRNISKEGEILIIKVL